MWGKAVLITTTVVAAVVLIVNPATSQQVESAQTLEPQRSSTQLAPSPDTRLKKITLDNLDPTRVRQVAFERTQRKIRESKPARDQSRHYLTPNVDRKLVRLARKQIPVMGGFYKDLVTVSDFNFLWANSRDGENLKQLFCEKLKQCLQIKPSEFCNLGTGANYYAYCHNSGADKNLFAMYLMHGYTHAVQASLGTNHMPNWFGEGTAQYFENHFARIHYGIKDRNFKPDFTNTIRTLYTNQKLVKFRKNPTEQNFIDAFSATDNRFPRNGREQASLGYYPGALAVEALIATHGIDDLFAFWKNSQRKDFYLAFEEAYGITTKEFYEKLAPYAVEMIKMDR
jgi:hypothetical protein